MNQLYEDIVRVVVEQAIREATEADADIVTLKLGVLKTLWGNYQARGEALDPFAVAADALTTQPDDMAVAVRVTCGDLRAARQTRPR